MLFWLNFHKSIQAREFVYQVVTKKTGLVNLSFYVVS